MPSLIDLMLEGRKIRQHSPWPRIVVDAHLWKFAAGELAQGGWSLLGLWGEPTTVHMAVIDRDTAEVAVISLDCPSRVYPSVSQHHPPAIRLERTINDLFGLTAEDLPDARPWLDHNCWGVRFPLSDRIDALSTAVPYRFLAAEGDGMHQIAVGPVHAGIIEPGHFRFTASGETVVRLEQRLGYTHKGIEGLMRGASVERGAELAGRVSGDSTVAYAYAFSRAAERRCNLRCRRERSGCGRCLRNSTARQPSRRHRRDLQRCVLRPDAGPLQRAARGRSPRVEHRLRSPPDAGRHRSRRARSRSRRKGASEHPCVARQYPYSLSRTYRTLRQHRLASGSHRRHRHRHVGAGEAVRRWRLCGARIRSHLRCPPGSGICPVSRSALRGTGARRG